MHGGGSVLLGSWKKHASEIAGEVYDYPLKEGETVRRSEGLMLQEREPSRDARIRCQSKRHC